MMILVPSPYITLEQRCRINNAPSWLRFQSRIDVLKSTLVESVFHNRLHDFFRAANHLLEQPTDEFSEKKKSLIIHLLDSPA